MHSGQAAWIRWLPFAQMLAAAKEEWQPQRCIKPAEQVEQRAVPAFRPPVLARLELLLSALPSREQATLVSTGAWTLRSRKVRPALAEVMKAWPLWLQASELVWASQQQQAAQARMESASMLARLQPSSAPQNCLLLWDSQACQARSCATIHAQRATSLLLARC